MGAAAAVHDTSNGEFSDLSAWMIAFNFMKHNAADKCDDAIETEWSNIEKCE